MLEFERSVESLGRQLDTSRKSFDKGWKNFHSAEKSYEEAKKTREQILQNILEKKGLAVCCSPHTDWESNNVENPSAQQLGIYPKNEMRLFYRVDGPYTIQGEYGDSVRKTTKLELLCPKHFPQNREWVSSQTGGYTLIISEAVVRNGKYTLLVDDSDVSPLVAQKPRGLSISINPEGRPLFLIDNPVYRHFGIPDLPKKPEHDDVRYGK